MRRRSTDLVRLRRFRLALLALALASLGAKAVVAWTTTGTDDALFWRVFADTVRRVGPIDIYSERLPVRFNHPPPIGWLLAGLNRLTDLGLPFRFLIRMPASLADVGTVFVVFELLRRRISPRVAFAAAAVLAVNPVLFAISGFHGNTDSVFVFLVLLGVLLLADLDKPVLAGVALAAALGVKLVPIVVALVMLAAAVRRGRGVPFSTAVGAAVLASWLPALLREYPAMKANVFGYDGQQGDWGVGAVLRGLGLPGALDVYAGPGRYVVIAVAALPAAYWVWRRPEDLPAAVGLSLVTLLALSPAFGPQYLAWPLAAGMLLSPLAAAVYSLVAGTVLAVFYTQWSGGFPWDWAHPQRATRTDLILLFGAWLVLVVWSAVGMRRLALAVRVSRRPVGTSGRDRLGLSTGTAAWQGRVPR
jgi:4-amino-4-deoxy-L-arabinose transferase-like glycosyltransferase